MIKRMVRCYTAYAEACGVYNNEVLYMAQEGYFLRLATCVVCGEIFVVDLENPKTAQRGLSEIAGGSVCPKCNSNLSDSIREYPETFVAQNMCVGSFTPPTRIPPDAESKIIEVWEIVPAE